MMVKEKYGIRQFVFHSHEYCKYLFKNSDGDYFMISVTESNMLFLTVRMRLSSLLNTTDMIFARFLAFF